MRQKTRIRIGPEPGIERVEPFVAPRLNDGAPALFKGFFQKLRQGFLKRLLLEMVKPDFSHMPNS